MNTMTLVRDLVYQARYTEALKASYRTRKYSTVFKTYIKDHSKDIKYTRLLVWGDVGFGHGREDHYDISNYNPPRNYIYQSAAHDHWGFEITYGNGSSCYQTTGFGDSGPFFRKPMKCVWRRNG